jgi:hypothetical protein
LERQLTSAVESRDGVSKKIEVLTDSITSLDLQVLDLESNNEVAAEVGPLRYMSEITGKSMATIVNWFTLLIVFVFDPLAISMVIALNKLTKKDEDGTNLNVLTFTNNNLGDTLSDDASDEDNGESIPIPTNEVGEERNEEVQEAPEEVKKEKVQKEEVEFIPTDEEAKDLYGETHKPKKKPSGNIKHVYRNASMK